MLDDRKLAVLRAIVEDFVQTNEPVGSKMVAERHVLGVSSATIRIVVGPADQMIEAHVQGVFRHRGSGLVVSICVRGPNVRRR